jgi:hypothetical protein
MGGDNQPRAQHSGVSGALVDDGAIVAAVVLDELREGVWLPYRCPGDRGALKQQSIKVFAAYGPAPAALGGGRLRRQLRRDHHTAGVNPDPAHPRSGDVEQRIGNA